MAKLQSFYPADGTCFCSDFILIVCVKKLFRKFFV